VLSEFGVYGTRESKPVKLVCWSCNVSRGEDIDLEGSEPARQRRKANNTRTRFSWLSFDKILNCTADMFTTLSLSLWHAVKAEGEHCLQYDHGLRQYSLTPTVLYITGVYQRIKQSEDVGSRTMISPIYYETSWRRTPPPTISRGNPQVNRI
jgi:hypothetical protein